MPMGFRLSLFHRPAVFAALFGLVAVVAFAPQQAHAVLKIDVTRGTIQALPVAIPPFLGSDPKLGADIAEVVTADLKRSGLFQPLDPASFIEKISNIDQPPRFGDWR